MVHCNAMICQQVTLSGDAEWPKVADAVIEAPLRIKYILFKGRGGDPYQEEQLRGGHTSPAGLTE